MSLRKATILMWAICVVHVAANVERWLEYRRAGLPIKWLPRPDDSWRR